MPFRNALIVKIGLLFAIALSAASCRELDEPTPPSAFLHASTPTPVPPSPPPPTPSPPGTPAPPPRRLTGFLAGCRGGTQPVVSVFELRQHDTVQIPGRFHRWPVRRSRALSFASAESVLELLLSPATYHPDTCLCSFDPPDFGIRLSCGSTVLDLVVDPGSVWVLQGDSREQGTIDSLAHGRLNTALRNAVRGGA